VNRAARRRLRRQLAAWGADPRRWAEPADLSAECAHDVRLARVARDARRLDALLALCAAPRAPRGVALARLAVPLALVVLIAAGFASAWREPASVRPPLEALALL
jgi:hypothetical protein